MGVKNKIIGTLLQIGSLSSKKLITLDDSGKYPVAVIPLDFTSKVAGTNVPYYSIRLTDTDEIQGIAALRVDTRSLMSPLLINFDNQGAAQPNQISPGDTIQIEPGVVRTIPLPVAQNKQIDFFLALSDPQNAGAGGTSTCWGTALVYMVGTILPDTKAPGEFNSYVVFPETLLVAGIAAAAANVLPAAWQFVQNLNVRRLVRGGRLTTLPTFTLTGAGQLQLVLNGHYNTPVTGLQDIPLLRFKVSGGAAAQAVQNDERFLPSGLHINNQYLVGLSYTVTLIGGPVTAGSVEFTPYVEAPDLQNAPNY